MNQQHSGSRWEPPVGEEFATQPLEGTVVTAPRQAARRDAVTTGPDRPWNVSPPARRARRTPWFRRRWSIGGAALALVLAGGAGGFALGAASGPDAVATVPGQTGTSPFGGADGRPGLRGGTFPDGTSLPDRSTLPDGNTGSSTGTGGTTTT